eukprot:COSAG03_NODE_497_length_7415_cov_2.348004_5_plen_49_part_00
MGGCKSKAHVLRMETRARLCSSVVRNVPASTTWACLGQSHPGTRLTPP